MSGEKVLIAEAEGSLLTLLRIFLESWGYQVLTVSDGQEALQAIAKGKPDLVLLDIMLPKVDGWEVCRRIKQNPETSKIAVVFVSSRKSDHDLLRGYEAGADAYITKPFKSSYLLERLRHCLAAQA